MTWITVLTLCFAAPVETGCIELAQYESREECRISAQRVRVHTSGARLSCQRRVSEPVKVVGR